jgi:DNA-binding response OmpR family regulator
MQGKKILVVDDDTHNNQLVKTAFTAEGAEVIVTTDGQAGWRQFHAHKPDLVIMSLMMPALDGWETSQRMLAAATVPIIMLTALGDDEEMLHGLEQGMIDYVTKPFSPRVLVARARSALRHV